MIWLVIALICALASFAIWFKGQCGPDAKDYDYPEYKE